jgi:hypothetical protein
MSVRPDNRLADAPMHPVACRSCTAVVQVRKGSWQQTSVQWSEQAMAACTSWDPGCASRGQLPVCELLRESIAEAVVTGELPVLDDRF